MNELLNLTRNITPALQKYFLAEDSAAYLTSLSSDSIERRVIELIRQRPIANLEERLNLLSGKKWNKQQVQSIKEEFLQLSLMDENTSRQQKIKIIETLKKNRNCKFDYAKPAEFIETSTEKMTQQNAKPAPCKLSKTDILEDVKEKILNKNLYLNISSYWLLKLDQEFLINLLPETQKTLINKDKLTMNYKPQFLCKIINKIVLALPSSSFNYSNLTLEQLEAIFNSQLEGLKSIRKNAAFLQTYIHAKFNEKLEILDTKSSSISHKEQKKQILKEIMNFALPESYELNGFKSLIALEMLYIDIQMQNPKKEDFINYLENFSTQVSLMTEQLRKKRQAQSKRSNSVISPRFNIQHKSMGTEKIIEQYLQLLFIKEAGKDQKLIKEMKLFFKSQILEKLSVKTKLSLGIKDEKAEEILGKDKYQEIRKQKFINILPTNKERFGIDQDVVLKIKVKNVDYLNIKIYEIDLQRKHKSGSINFSDDNVSFLKPTSISKFQLEKADTFKQTTYDVPLKFIQKRAGGYIVIFENQGLESRAVIQKGGMIIYENVSEAGKQLSFYDENGMKITDYRLWFEDKEEQVKDIFTIPMTDTRKNYQIIVVKDSNVATFYVETIMQIYQLKAKYIYNHQSFIVGSKARIIICPSLWLAQKEYKPLTLKLLNNIKITVQIEDVHGVLQLINIQNVDFNDGDDYILDIPIKSYTRQIAINVSAQIQKCSGKKQTVKSSHLIGINLLTNQNSSNFCDIYLNHVNNQYQCSLLGLNGQPIKKRQLAVNILFDGYQSNFTQILTTNDQGKIFLGSLTNISTIQVSYEQIFRVWKIKSKKPFAFTNLESKQNVLAYKQGQTIELPIGAGHQAKDFSLRKKSKYLANGKQYTQTISINNDKLVIKGLQKGEYNLNYLKDDIDYTFNIIEGTNLEGTSTIFNKKHLITTKINKNWNEIASFKQQKIIENENQYEIEITVNQGEINPLKNVRVHITASYFGQGQFENLSKLFNEPFWNQQSIKTKGIIFPQCSYKNNRLASDEERYVNNRATQKQTIGNYLEKPRIFLKRILVGQTTQNDEMLRADRPYGDQREMSRAANQCRSRAQKEMMMMKKAMCSKQIRRQNLFTNHNNFLLNSAFCLANLKESKLTVKVPKHYNFLNCYLLNNDQVLVKEIPLKATVFKTKDIRHKGLDNQYQDKGWTMSRQIYKVRSGQTLKVNRDSQWSLVGISEIMQYSKIKGHQLKDWVLNWQNYSQEKKQSEYDKEYCHELNVYLSENDKAFFEKIVKPFISNKLIKTFVDYYLLNNQICSSYAQLSKFLLLNQFEKILLIKYLLRNGQNEKAMAIANQIKSETENMKIQFNNFKNCFDTIINAKSFQSNPGIVEQRQCMEERKDKCQKKKMKKRAQIVQGFKPIEKTKQYVEVTYQGIKNQVSTQLIRRSMFWAQLASHLIKKPEIPFISESFLYLQGKRDFTLALCFIPNKLNLDCGLQAEDENIIIKANSPFLVFVKEVKLFPYEKKFGIMMNQRFTDPNNRYIYDEDGTALDVEVEEFIVNKQYEVQTIVTNTGVSKLQIQILLDIPQGAIPLKSLENTQIINKTLNSFTTEKFVRYFYFPKEGEYKIYPTCVCKGKTIIAKANSLANIQVKRMFKNKKAEKFTDFMLLGDKQKVLQFLAEKNIFDHKQFNINSILWMLKDQQFFRKVITILRKRYFFEQNVWEFGFLHKDQLSAKQLIQYQPNGSISSQYDEKLFQYYPYETSRTHQFQNESQSTIRNTNFKKAYQNLLFTALFKKSRKASFKLAFAYYLILQDRIQQATHMVNMLTSQQLLTHQIQLDYIDCFIDMKEGYPNFIKARKIAHKYLNYPVLSWRKLFAEVDRTLKQFDTEDFIQEKKIIAYQTSCEEENNKLKIKIPPELKVRVSLYAVNLELFFSIFPGQKLEIKQGVKPTLDIIFEAGASRQQTIIRPADLQDIFVTIEQIKDLQKIRKVKSFHWVNSDLSIQLNEAIGSVKIYYKQKKLPGCYCKVFSRGQDGCKFYKDGYTDITGSFRYIQANLQGINKFLILLITEHGGKIMEANLPNQTARY